jgi:glycine/D-amino acid oxidase-like deaminating enzyme
VGAAVAYFLARRGVPVTVIERSGVACAASGKSGGFLALDWCANTPLGPLARAKGTVPGSHRVPAPRWIDGPAIVAGALGSTDTTAQVHPARFTGALLDEARARGTALRTGVVEGVARRDRRVHGVMVDGETLEGDAVVLAMGPWTGRLGGLGLPRIHGLKGYRVTLAARDAPATGLALAELITEGTAASVDLSPFDPARLPPAAVYH